MTASSFNVMCSVLKSLPPPIAPTIGVMMLATNDVTTAPNAAPMTTATARSTTLPRKMNALNSLNMCPPIDQDFAYSESASASDNDSTPGSRTTASTQSGRLTDATLMGCSSADDCVASRTNVVA